MRKITLKTLSLLLAALLIILPFSSCSGVKPYSEGEGELKIVASCFVAFDVARQIAGENATITLLQSNGGDLHDYTPTTAALKALSEADVFICIGGVSDELWAEDAARACNNGTLTVIKLISAVAGEIAELEGHSKSPFCEQNHEHSHHEEHSVSDGHGHTSDEHIWTSLKNTALIADEIAGACAEKDTSNASLYLENAQKYKAELSLLDAEYKAVFDESVTKTLVFADRFPFIYLIRDYGACYYAAFSGCSSEISTSFETAVKLTEAIQKNLLSHVIVTENSDKKLASSISSITSCEILTLNSLQSVSLGEIKDGITYLDVMKSNLQVLKTALSSNP